MSKKILMFFASLPCIFFVLSTQAATNTVAQPHELTYAVSVDFGFSISGTMVQTLKPKGHGTWSFRRKASALGFKAEESSVLTFRNNSVQASSYKKKEFGFGSDDVTEFSINSPKIYDTVTLVLRIAEDLNTGVDIEKQSYQVQEDEDSYGTYRFKVRGIEKVSTKMGTFHALRVDKVEKKGNQTTFWFLPEAAHLIVKGISVKEEGSDVTLSLKKGTLNNIKILAKK